MGGNQPVEQKLMCGIRGGSSVLHRRVADVGNGREDSLDLSESAKESSLEPLEVNLSVFLELAEVLFLFSICERGLYGMRICSGNEP